MKIPFDIKYKPQIESGEYKVETRDGSPARIICWDRHATEPFDRCILVALITSRNSDESAYYYYSDGHLWDRANGEDESRLDLFIITNEPELTPFEQHLLVYFQKVYYAHCESQDVNNFLIGTIKQSSKSLLEFAKKEICKGCSVGLNEYWRGKEDARKEAEESYTFHYPFYPTMCFHGGICTNPFKDYINCPNHSSGTTINTTSGTCKKEE